MPSARLCTPASLAPRRRMAIGARARRLCPRRDRGLLKSRSSASRWAVPGRGDHGICGRIRAPPGARGAFRAGPGGRRGASRCRRSSGSAFREPRLYVPFIGESLRFERTLCTEVLWTATVERRIETPNRRGDEKVRCLEWLRTCTRSRDRRVWQQRLRSGSYEVRGSAVLVNANVSADAGPPNRALRRRIGHEAAPAPRLQQMDGSPGLIGMHRHKPFTTRWTDSTRMTPRISRPRIGSFPAEPCWRAHWPCGG